MNAQSIRRLVIGVVLLLAVFALPYLVTGAAGRILAVSAMLYGLVVVSWNLTIGYGGMYNFAHVGFFGLGGYATAISATAWGWSPWVGLLLGAAVGAVGGAIAFLPAIRMRGIYLGLITFVFVQICRYLVLAGGDATGGSQGISGVPPLTVGAFDLSEYSGLGYLWLIGLVLVLFLYVVGQAVRSDFGRSLIALRDNEALAISRGVNRVRQQLLSFVLSGALAGVAGGLYVTYYGVADSTLFGFSLVTLGLSMIFLGGLAVVWGPLLGAVALTVVDRQLNGLAEWSSIIIGVGTVIVLIFLPHGVAGALRRAGAWAVDAIRSRRRSA